MQILPGPAFLFGAGLDEWALWGAIAFLLFGPKRLPEIARTLGRTLEKLRRAADEFREQIAHLDDPVISVRSADFGVRTKEEELPKIDSSAPDAEGGPRGAEGSVAGAKGDLPAEPPSTVKPAP